MKIDRGIVKLNVMTEKRSRVRKKDKKVFFFINLSIEEMKTAPNSKFNLLTKTDRRTKIIEMITETHNTITNHTLGDKCWPALRSIFNQHELIDADDQMKCFGFLVCKCLIRLIFQYHMKITFSNSLCYYLSLDW